MSGPPRTSWNSGVRPLHSLVLFSALALIALAIGITTVARGLTASFSQLEQAATRQKAEQVYRAFEADLRQLAISNRDYAQWDDAQQYIRTRDPDFIQANFLPETLSAMHVDVVWIVDSTGADIFSTFLDRRTIKTQTPRQNY